MMNQQGAKDNEAYNLDFAKPAELGDNLIAAGHAADAAAKVITHCLVARLARKQAARILQREPDHALIRVESRVKLMIAEPIGGTARCDDPATVEVGPLE